jgi:GNAT superfamily N-acetyltransferase
VVDVRILHAAELAWANARYAEVEFQPSRPRDCVALASIDGQRAGLGRLVAVDGDCGELGGIFVLPGYRGRGVAHAVVGYLLQRSSYPTLYCLPFAHLERFYRGFGFAPVDAAAPVPSAIADKRAWCARQYVEPVSLLVRTTAARPQASPGT